MQAPRVSVLMSVYNGEKYLKEAIESILNQTYADFEFLIINDGSTDNSEKLILSYQDDRIRLINNDKNIGLIKSLNKGLELAQGEYIVRMDADDISLPTRIFEQVAFLDAHSNVVAVGGYVQYFGRLYNNKTIKHPSDTDIVKITLLLHVCLTHPVVTIRRDVLIKHNLRYSEQYLHIEDYDLFVCLLNYGDLANIDKVLLKYRYHGGQISRRFREQQDDLSIDITHYQLANKLNLSFSKAEIDLLKLPYHKKIQELSVNQSCEEILKSIHRLDTEINLANKTNSYYEPLKLERFLTQHYENSCILFGITGFRFLLRHPLTQNTHQNYFILFAKTVKILLKKWLKGILQVLLPNKASL